MKILIIRRDNIGDLILTTPLIATLSEAYGAKVDVLVNTYNKSVLENNPSVGRVHLYQKLSHRKAGQSAIKMVLNRVKTYIDVRFARYDVAIIASGHWSKHALPWAKFSGAKRIIAIGDDAPASITDVIPTPKEPLHTVKLTAELSKPLGVYQEPGPLKLYLTPEEVGSMRSRLALPENVPIYGIQISSRKPLQRWQAEKFIEFAHKISEHEKCHFLLFWSPGSADNKEHPGDDEKAQQIIDACHDLPLTPVVTKNIRELMAAMSLCDQVLTSDGGALHIAAGVGIPVVAMFGNSNSVMWGPWGVPCEILDAPERNVGLLEVNDVYQRFITLRARAIAEKSGNASS